MMTPVHAERRAAVDVTRVVALGLVVMGHLVLAVIDRDGGEVRGANLLELHPGWALLLAAAPMPLFFAAGGYANARTRFPAACRRLAVLAGLGTVVVGLWSAAVAVTVLITGEAGIIGDGARLATQPLWFVAAYAPMAAGAWWLARLAGAHPVLSIGGCLAGLVLLDTLRFALDGPRWIGWPGFALAWLVPWLAGAWWRTRDECASWDRHAEARTGVALAAIGVLGGLVLVHAFGYAPALIDAVPGARSNTTPPTLYTAVVGLAQVGVLLMLAGLLDRIGARWRPLWDRGGEMAVGVYVWHLTALALCAAVVAAGLPVPRRLTTSWWVTRPAWWAAVLAVTVGLVVLTDVARRRLRRRHRAGDGPRVEQPRSKPRDVAGVALLTVGGAAVGLEGPHSLPLGAAFTGLFAGSWLLLRDP